ncbi:hypothetical protein [Komagataeibacter xylinus]|nr:hypothetical protein [Komagataeibacter xylinus]
MTCIIALFGFKKTEVFGCPFFLKAAFPEAFWKKASPKTFE